MRTILLFIVSLLTLFLGAVFVLTKMRGPEKLLVGKWQEVSWEFEKVDQQENNLFFADEDFQRNEICKDLLIHKAEVWEFQNDGTLVLSSKDHQPENLRWNIKGRGHILVLAHGDDRLESFQIQEISHDSLVIHFGFDLQVRGIVKMTFVKIDDSNA